MKPHWSDAGKTDEAVSFSLISIPGFPSGESCLQKRVLTCLPSRSVPFISFICLLTVYVVNTYVEPACEGTDRMKGWVESRV